MATTDSDKLPNLKSAVAGLNQIRFSLISRFNFFFNLSSFAFSWNRFEWTILAISNRTWFDFYFYVDFWICSENEKNGFINLVARYLRWIAKFLTLMLAICLDLRLPVFILQLCYDLASCDEFCFIFSDYFGWSFSMQRRSSACWVE